MDSDKCCAGEHALTDVKEDAKELVEQAQPALAPVAETPQGD